ncbi:MAG: multicopper oxidase domain-containing protein [Flavobacteriales bacterium]|nr:multicopper oxidase domain-containing protein [Flavobacteriales bacterium]
MAFIIDNSITSKDPIVQLPTSNPKYALEDRGDVYRERTKRLGGKGGSGGKWTINDSVMKMKVLNDTILVNKMEEWTIENLTNQAHPFHIHKVQFQVVEYHGKLGLGDDIIDYNSDFDTEIPEELIGFKDVQLVRGYATMKFIARFDSFPYTDISPSNGFMYHCHILTHEDQSMMAQFTVVDADTYFKFFTAIPEEIEMGGFTLYPNPATGVITITGSMEGNGTLYFRDLLGRT